MEILENYLPKNSIKIIFNLIKENNIHFKVTPKRNYKHGDYKIPNKITVNGSLNKYAFFITTIHEIAHFITFKQIKTLSKPHGKEWKKNFINLIKKFNLKEIFPEDLLPFVENYFINPKASTNSDEKLYLALRKYNSNDNNSKILDEINDGDIFILKGEKFQRIEKKRTLILCEKISNKKKYLIKTFAEIEI